MKKLLLYFGLLFAGLVALAQAQIPDPRDSVILESKSVLPGGGRPAFTIRVYVTNKDSLTGGNIFLAKRKMTGNADAVIFVPCCPYRYLNFLTNTLRFRGACIPECYDSNPDTLKIFVYSDPFDPATIEPPNAVRKELLEIKFDSVPPYLGTVELDSVQILGMSSSFFTTGAQEMPVNFVKSIITVMPKGDFNLDGALSAADVVELVNCIFLQEIQPSGPYPCDLNCDGRRSSADILLEIMAIFQGLPFPC